MPKKNWRAPEPRSFAVRVNYTAREKNRVEALAKAAQTPLAVYIREVTLGTFVERECTVPALDYEQLSVHLGKLHEFGEPLKLLVDLLADGEEPRHRDWSKVEQDLAKAIDRLTIVLAAK